MGKKSTVKSVEEHKVEILEQLRTAGEKGRTKSALNVKSEARKQALSQLEKERVVGNLGNFGNSKSIYVLAEYYKPLEMAMAEIHACIRKNGLTLTGKGKFKDIKTYSAVKKHFDNALDYLINEKKILRVKAGRNYSYLAVEPVLTELGLGTAVQTRQSEFADSPAPAVESSPSLASASAPPVQDYTLQVMPAYERLKRRTRFSAVDIYALHQESGVPLEELKHWILQMRRIGRAELFFGDWSLSSPEERTGAIEIQGERFLLVRFPDSRDEAS